MIPFSPGISLALANIAGAQLKKQPKARVMFEQRVLQSDWMRPLDNATKTHLGA